MTQVVSLDLLIACLIALLLVLMVLLILCWTLKRNRARDRTEVRISSRYGPYVLTIKPGPEKVKQLVDELLDRYISVELEPETGKEPEFEFGDEEPEEERASASVSLQTKGVFSTPPDAPPCSSSSLSRPPDNLDIERADVSQHASVPPGDAPCGAETREEDE